MRKVRFLANRLKLRDLMARHGWVGYEKRVVAF